MSFGKDLLQSAQEALKIAESRRHPAAVYSVEAEYRRPMMRPGPIKKVSDIEAEVYSEEVIRG